MPFFVLIIRWVESSDFGLKSDDLGHRILKSDLIPSDLAKSDCISRPILFSDRKKSRSSESDRIVNGLRRIIMWIRFRASDFGLVAKINIIRAKSKQASCAEMVLGSFVFLLV